jgi:hypothetical protein
MTLTPLQEIKRRAAIHAAALVLAEARAHRDSLSPREAAEEAWFPGHELGTVDAIEAGIIRQRAEAEEQWANGTHPFQLRRQQQALPDAA